MAPGVFTCVRCGSTLPLTYQAGGAVCQWCAGNDVGVVARPEPAPELVAADGEGE